MPFKSVRWFLIGAALVYAVMRVAPLGATDNPCEKPDLFSYPHQAEDFWILIDKHAILDIRKHAWKRFEEIIGPEDQPAWIQWKTKEEAFRTAVPTTSALRSVKPLPLEPPPQFGIAKPLRQTVHFNAFAEKRIHRTGDPLNDHKLLSNWRDELGMKFIIPFPRESVVVKSIWWPVKSASARIRSPLPVWTELVDYPPDHDQIELPYTKWKDYVWIEPPNSNATDNCAMPKWTSAASVVCPANAEKLRSIEDFYYRPILADEADDVKLACKEIYGDPCSTEDYLVLVGMHIATKELDDWFWMTFWWHYQPKIGIHGDDRIDTLNNNRKAGKFLMDVAFHGTAPREKDNHPNRAFNPWLEASMKNGVNSNCVTCHQRATWCVPLDNGSQVEIFPRPPDAAFFQTRLRLDYVWSVHTENFKKAFPPQK